MAYQAQPAVRVAGLPPGIALAPLGSRFVAYLIDTVIGALIGVLSWSLIWYTNLAPTVIALLSMVLAIVWVVVLWWMFAVGAAGPGMRVLRLQLVGLANGRAIGWRRFFLRQLILVLLAATGIGLLLMVIFLVLHPLHQGWHDLAVGSVVIRQRRAPTPTRPPDGRGDTGVGPARQASAPGLAPSKVAPLTPVPPLSRPPLSPPPLSPPPLSPPPVSAALSPPPQTYPPAQPGQYGSAPAYGSPPPYAPPQALRPQAPQPPVRQPRAPEAPVSRDAAPMAGTFGGSWSAVLDDGREIPVDGLILLGRNPQARPGEEHAALIKIADTTRTVSKSHLEVGLNSRGLYVIDRGSTNGSAVTGVSGVSRRCAPGEPVDVEPGSIVSFGDHWFEARHPSSGS